MSKSSTYLPLFELPAMSDNKGEEDLSTVKFCDDDINKQILLNIISAMYDKDATHVKFNELKRNIEPVYFKNKLEMHGMQLSISKLNNVFVWITCFSTCSRSCTVLLN